MQLAQALFVLGLFVDIVGAFVLAQGFIVKRLDSLTWEGTSGFGSPPNIRYISSMIAQKADAQVGFGVLAIGFMLQTLDYLLVSPAMSFSLAPWIVLTLSLLVSSLVFATTVILRRLLATRYRGKLLPLIVRSAGETTPNPNWVRFVIDHLAPEGKQGSGESDAAFVRRVLETYPLAPQVVESRLSTAHRPESQ